MANIVEFSSFRQQKDDSDDEKVNEYYTGGHTNHGGGSGLSVLGPGTGEHHDSIATIIARAQATMQETDQTSDTVPRHIITFYREGFTVNDGPYRRRDVPSNRLFLEAIEKGVVPMELESEKKSDIVDIRLVDKRSEEYKPPSAPRYTAFSGEGQRIGGTSIIAQSAVVQSSESQATNPPIIDDKQPTTTLQIRLHNGTRLRATLNLTHTIRDIHAIVYVNEAAAQSYTLLAGFPPRPLSTDLTQTIEEANLQGASITQKVT